MYDVGLDCEQPHSSPIVHFSFNEYNGIRTRPKADLVCEALGMRLN